MKKATMTAIVNYLSDNLSYADEDEKNFLQTTIDEINAELNKGAEEKAARAAAYEGIHSLIVDNLDPTTPVTCADLFGEIEAEVVAKGMTRHNVQYALNNLWQDEIVKIAGKPNTYRRA